MKDTKAETLGIAIAALRRGDVIVYPTETLYGLGADALNAAAVEKVFQLKDRDSASPISLLVADRPMLELVVDKIPPLAEELINQFWPGPLTMVLPATRNLSKRLTNSAGGVGVRISSQAIATDLVKELGRPLTATSANPSGKMPARTVEQARRYFHSKVSVFLDGGELHSNVGSTVVEISSNTIRIIREGEISKAVLARMMGQRNLIS